MNNNCSCNFCLSKSKCPQQQKSWIEDIVAAVVEKKIDVIKKDQNSRHRSQLRKFNNFVNIQVT